MASITVTFLAYAYIFAFFLNPPKSDYGWHIKSAEHLANGDLQLAHFLFHLIAAGVHTITTCWNLSAFVVVLSSMLLTAAILYTYIFVWVNGDTIRKALLGLVGVFCLLHVAPVYILAWKDGFWYLGYFLSFPVHNPTIICLAPFALALFILVDLSKKQTTATNFLCLFMIILSGLAKPTYLLIMLPAIVLLYICGYREIDKRHFFALCFTNFLMLLWMWLFVYVFRDGNGYSSRIDIGLFKYAFLREPNYFTIFLKLALSIAFPLYVLACNHGTKDFQYIYAWVLFMFAYLFFALFHEMPNIADGNFGWSAMTATFLLFVVSFRVFVENFSMNMRSYCGAALLGLHVASGLVYHVRIIWTAKYI